MVTPSTVPYFTGAAVRLDDALVQADRPEADSFATTDLDRLAEAERLRHGVPPRPAFLSQAVNVHRAQAPHGWRSKWCSHGQSHPSQCAGLRCRCAVAGLPMPRCRGQYQSPWQGHPPPRWRARQTPIFQRPVPPLKRQFFAPVRAASQDSGLRSGAEWCSPMPRCSAE